MSGVTVATMIASRSEGSRCALGKDFFGSLQAQIAAGHTFFRQVAFANSSAIENPLVSGIDHLLQVSVGKHPGRDIGSQSADLGAQKLTHSKGAPVGNVNPLLCRTCTSPVQCGVS